MQGSPDRIVRERVTADGIHQYCVAWRHADNSRAGFSWEESITLYDGGHGKVVRHFEASAALERRVTKSSPRGSRRNNASRGSSRGSLAPLASPIAPEQPPRPTTADPLMPDARGSDVRLRESQELAVDASRSSVQFELSSSEKEGDASERPASAEASLAPLTTKQPRERRSKSRGSNRSAPLSGLSALGPPRPSSNFKSLFDAPEYIPKDHPPSKVGENGYVFLKGLTLVRGRAVARVIGQSEDELRRAMLKSEVRKFTIVKKGADEGRMQHLTYKQPGIPGSYDRYNFMLHTAAVRIQAWLRGFMARAQLHLWTLSAINIQRHVRGHLGALDYDEELLLQRRVRWQFRKLAGLSVGKEVAAWRGRLWRLTQDCLGTRAQRNLEWSLTIFAENRDSEIAERIEAYLLLLKWAEEQRQKRLAICGEWVHDLVETVITITDPAEMLRAYLTEKGRASADVEKYVAESEALRVELTNDGRMAGTQREITELLFHKQEEFMTQNEFHTPEVSKKDEV